MRDETEMMRLILHVAEEDARIRLVSMEGSRTNVNVPADAFQDYDITYHVADPAPFIADESWLQRFGDIIMMQKPEAMELFPPEAFGFSYLMYFEDGNKLDLTVLSLDELDRYLAADKLVNVLLDKDSRIEGTIIPTDIDYHVKRPSARSFDDCCNEFWFVAPYAVKGLCRRELLFAIDHMTIMRKELLRMLSWKVGLDTGFSLSVGKNAKYIDRYLPEADWQLLLQTYRTDSYAAAHEALHKLMVLFRSCSREAAERLGFVYPPYDEAITAYTERIFLDYPVG